MNASCCEIFLGKVGDDQICSGSFQRGEAFQRDSDFIDPAILSCSLDLAVFPTDLIGDDRHVEIVTYQPNDVEIGQTGFDDQEIRAFSSIGCGFAKSFAPVARIHLIGFAISELGCAFCGIAEWSVKCRRVFYRVGHDRRVGEAGCVEGLTDSRNPAVHHVGWCDDIRTRPGLRDSRAPQQLKSRVILHFATWGNQSAVTVRSVLAQAGIGDDNEFRMSALDASNRFLNHAVVSIGLGTGWIFLCRNAEEDDAFHACVNACVHFLEQFVHAQLKLAGHGNDGLAEVWVTFDHEIGLYQIPGGNQGFPDKFTHGGGGTQSASAIEVCHGRAPCVRRVRR